MPRHRSRKNIQSLSSEKQKSVQDVEMLPTPTSSTAPSIGINARPTTVSKSAVRLGLGSQNDVSSPSQTLSSSSSCPTTQPKSSSNQAIDDALRAAETATKPAHTDPTKSYAAATSPLAGVAPPPPPQEQHDQQQQQQVETFISAKVEVDPSRNVQNFVQRDKGEFEPFATVCILAIRCVVPGAKLVVTPPLLALDRSYPIFRSIRSWFSSGLTQDVMFQLKKPLERAVQVYLRKETLHIFKLATAGLKSLQEIYKKSNAEEALQQMINLLESAYAPGKPLPTGPCITAPDEPFAGLWRGPDIATVASMFETINALGLADVKEAVTWTATMEDLLQRKLAVYL